MTSKFRWHFYLPDLSPSPPPNCWATDINVSELPGLDTVISSVSASHPIQFLCRPEECLQIFPITEHWIHWAGGSNIYLKLSRYLHIYLCFSCCPVTVQCAAAAAARCAASPIKYENMTCIRQQEAALPIQETRRQLREYLGVSISRSVHIIWILSR